MLAARQEDNRVTTGGVRSATYRLEEGIPLEIEHWETALTLTAEVPAVRPIPPRPPPADLRQPSGRAPRRRWP